MYPFSTSDIYEEKDIAITLSDRLITAVRCAFSEDKQSRVLDMLLRYGIEPHEQEQERVRLALVKLSAGDTDKLAALIDNAKMDSRDILWWAGQEMD